MSRTNLLMMAAFAALATACTASAGPPVDAASASTPVVVAAADIDAPPAALAVEAAPPAPMAAPRAESSSRQAQAAPAHHEVHYAPVTCEIRSRRTTNGVLIQARAFADHDVAAEYDLVITKDGAGGSADISQGGPVDLVAGTSATLGENEISVERGARVRAVLTLRDDGGQLCRRTFRL